MASKFASAALAALLLTAPASIVSATAQEAYPSKPIKIILPIPTGTALDVVTRLVSDDMAKRLGQPVIVEARPGAGGLLAAQAVMSARRMGTLCSAVPRPFSRFCRRKKITCQSTSVATSYRSA